MRPPASPATSARITKTPFSVAREMSARLAWSTSSGPPLAGGRPLFVGTNRAAAPRAAMARAGFKPYDKEWWHFTLEREPFPETYFDFVVR